MIATIAMLAAAMRIVSLSPATTEELLELGADRHVVAIDAFSERPARIKRFPRLGGIFDANAELVLAAQPSLVLYQAEEFDTLATAALRRARLNVVGLPGQRLEDAWRGIERVGQLTGRERQAKALVARLQAHIAQRARSVEHKRRLRVLVVSWDQPIASVAHGSFVDDLLERANLENVAKNAGTPWPSLSPEYVAKTNPDVVIVNTTEGFSLDRQRLPWNLLDAAKNRKIALVAPRFECGPYIDELFDAIVRSVAPFR